jgi:hypothetical protein
MTTRGDIVLVSKRHFDRVVPYAVVSEYDEVRSHRVKIFLPGSKSAIHLPRHLMGCTPGDKQVVDHIGGNSTTLDNRDSNLRIVTHQANINNCKMKKNNKSGVNGVYHSPKFQYWAAYIFVDGKRKQVVFRYKEGYNRTSEQAFQEAVAARRAYDEASGCTNGQRSC